MRFRRRDLHYWGEQEHELFIDSVPLHAELKHVMKTCTEMLGWPCSTLAYYCNFKLLVPEDTVGSVSELSCIRPFQKDPGRADLGL
jgi:hypothetical protein